MLQLGYSHQECAYPKQAHAAEHMYIYIYSQFILKIFYIRRSTYFYHVDDDEDDDYGELAIAYPLLYLPYTIFPLQLPRRVQAPLYMSHSISAREVDEVDSSPARWADAADSSLARGAEAADGVGVNILLILCK